MSRSPLNNPTERILRLLDCASAMEAHILHLEEQIAQRAPDLLQHLAARPDLTDYRLEMQRQQLTHGRTLKVRKYMQRVRSASELGNEATSFKNIRQHARATTGLTAARKAEIDRLVAEAAPTPIPAGEVLAVEHAIASEIGLGEGVEIEPSPDTENLEADLKDGSLFK